MPLELPSLYEVDAQAAIDAMSRIKKMALRSALIDALLCVYPARPPA